MSDRFNVLPQYLFPKKALTTFAGKIANAKAGRVTSALIRWFVGYYGVDMKEAADPHIENYATFNEFFTRALRPGVRPLAQADFTCPVDGSISQFGAIDADRIIQAKNHNYTTVSLVGGDRDLAAHFDHGSFATLYLSPKDYHRIHMPCEGRLLRMIFMPGRLFSVNPVTTRAVPQLFARNERVVCVFDSAYGPFVLALVGATIVGSIATVWHGIVNPPDVRDACEWHYDQQQIVLKKGDEMGHFSLGSTVVTLFPRNRLRFNPEWMPGREVRLGEMMATTVDERSV